MSHTASTPHSHGRDKQRPTPRQKPPKTYVVNTDGTILPEEFSDKHEQQQAEAPSDLKRPRHYRNVALSFIGVLVLLLIIMAFFGG